MDDFRVERKSFRIFAIMIMKKIYVFYFCFLSLRRKVFVPFPSFIQKTATIVNGWSSFVKVFMHEISSDMMVFGRVCA